MFIKLIDLHHGNAMYRSRLASVRGLLAARTLGVLLDASARTRLSSRTVDAVVTARRFGNLASSRVAGHRLTAAIDAGAEVLDVDVVMRAAAVVAKAHAIAFGTLSGFGAPASALAAAQAAAAAAASFRTQAWAGRSPSAPTFSQELGASPLASVSSVASTLGQRGRRITMGQAVAALAASGVGAGEPQTEHSAPGAVL